ncbi:MAG: ribbon-helix-helix protein, CopG family [Alkalispirochaeta sp.]
MKNIQVSLDETSIAGLDSVAHHQQKTRAAVIREAVDAWLRRQRIASFENAWIAAAQNEDTRADDSDAWFAAETWSEE